MLKRQNETDRTIYVGNLDPNVKEEILYELFLQAGPLTKVTIPKDKEGNFKSFGFVCFKHTESVPYAIALLNDIRLYGRPIKLQYRFGSSFTSESQSDPQCFDNAFVPNPLGYGTNVLGESSNFSQALNSMDNGLLSPSYSYIMQMLIASQCTNNGWMNQGPPYFNPTVNWNNNFPFPAFEQPNCRPGPSSVVWTPKNVETSDVFKNSKGSLKRKRKMHNTDTGSDSSASVNDEKEKRHKYGKHKSKRRRP